MTTDGPNLDPELLRAVFSDVPHQLCTFPIIKELTKAILRAVAKVRKKLAARKSTLKRGRPATVVAKLAKLRRRVGRFKAVGKVLSKLQPPNLEKALTFLDDKLLSSTSNAVERGDHRFSL